MLSCEYTAVGGAIRCRQGKGNTMRFGSLAVTVVAAATLMLLLACGGGSSNQAAAPAAPAVPQGPLTVSVSWTEAADVDLIVDGNKAYDMGGTPDVRQGPGMESVVLQPGVHKIGVRNNSADKDVQLTLKLTIPGMPEVTRSGMVSKDMSRDDWTAFSVDCATGVVTDLNLYE